MIALGLAGLVGAAVVVTLVGRNRSESVRIVAAGDMACDPDDPNFLAHSDAEGDHCRQDDVSTIALRLEPDLVLGLGDYQYELPTADAYRDVYAPSWGRLRAITVPVFGNQEFKVRDAYPFTAYFGDRIRDERGYWSQDVGAWHLIVLNSNCTIIAGGCAEGSPQQRWLAEDLAATDRQCVLASWHHPRWSNGIAGPDDRTADLYATLAAHRVELLLSGHEADYERFGPLDPTGQPDPTGVRQVVVGVGGQAHYEPTEDDVPWRGSWGAPPSEFVDYAHHGLLALELAEGGWSWRFHALAAESTERTGAVVDEGEERCF
ncbi:MAG: alkaline phosphatase [Dactylosporangium sp.]|nr:metallophosphoesterase [Dactylosporangium sp.]NNJ60992.1 alkaline phosphatase [Dactylosporangium sp.]